MAALVILLMVTIGAAALIACLKGFSQAGKHKRGQGVFVDVQRTSIRKKSDSRECAWSQAGGGHELAPGQVCGTTAALVEMAILLGSQHASTKRGPHGFAPIVARLRHGIRLRRRTRTLNPIP